MYIMDGLIPLFESMKNGDIHHDFCIDDAIFHIKKATEALTEGLADPIIWHARSEACSRIIIKFLPVILALQIAESLGEGTPPVPEGNL